METTISLTPLLAASAVRVNDFECTLVKRHFGVDTCGADDGSSLLALRACNALHQLFLDLWMTRVRVPSPAGQICAHSWMHRSGESVDSHFVARIANVTVCGRHVLELLSL